MNVKQYLALIKSFYKRHKQINTVESGNQFNFNANDKHVYPVAHIEYINDSTLGDFKTYNFFVTLADLFDPNLEGSEEDIYSDMSEIADDTHNFFLNKYDVPYEVNESITKRKFTNGHTDNLRGQTFMLSFNEFNEAKDCVIPLRNI